ncbi:MAG TPA: serine/threonine-protein kinase [Vicinamibacterales bacterium]
MPHLSDLKSLLLEARERTGEDRARFLDQACAGRPELRREIESLLAFDDRAPALLDTGVAFDRLPPTLEILGASRASGYRPGDRIGPYTLVDVIGEGGMGIVYRVEQTHPIRRTAALKLIRRGLDTDRIVARFDSERQALARMEHPGIARVLDAGASADGRPYFVMELVQGTPITQFADRERLTTRERVELFLLVCQAVQHAHQKGIIHRDLKPSNILVSRQDGVAVPKIIDFGIAKAIAEPLGQDQLLTREGQFIGTPDYMSPEQAGAIDADVDTRTDVYALGVLLYELLCGQRPHRFARRTEVDVQEVLKRHDPARPSTVTTTRRLARVRTPTDPERLAQVAEARRTTVSRLRRQLSGDLDTIVLKALQREPSRRYDSVEQFAADLRRHLDGLPVLARPDSFLYRTQKFVRRNALMVGLATTGVLLLVAIVIALAIGSARIAQERDRALAAERRARTEAETAEQVSRFLIGLFRVSNPSEARGQSITAREMLDRGATDIDALVDRPEIQARLMHVMGEVYKSLALYDQAASLLERALALRIQLHGETHADVAATLDALGDTYRYWGRTGEAEPHLRRALAIRRALYGEVHVAVGQSLNNLALVLDDQRHYEESEQLHREALRIRRAAAGDHSPDVANSLSNLGRLLNLRNKYAEAEAVLRECLALRESLFGREHPLTAITMGHLTRSLLDQGRAAEAEASAREVLRIRRRVHEPGHADITRGLVLLAATLRETGGLAEAESLLREALARERRRVGDTHVDTASVIMELGLVRERSGDLRGAEAFFRQALAIRRNQRDRRHPRVAGAMAALGRVLAARQQTREAERLMRDALAIRIERLGSEHLEVANTKADLAAVLARIGRQEEARKLATEALDLQSRILPSEHRLVRATQDILAQLR